MNKEDYYKNSKQVTCYFGRSGSGLTLASVIHLIELHKLYPDKPVLSNMKLKGIEYEPVTWQASFDFEGGIVLIDNLGFQHPHISYSVCAFNIVIANTCIREPLDSGWFLRDPEIVTCNFLEKDNKSYLKLCRQHPPRKLVMVRDIEEYYQYYSTLEPIGVSKVPGKGLIQRINSILKGA